MKKRTLISLALIGLGLFSSGCEKAKADEMSPEMRSFYQQLSPEAKKKFMQLDSQHKAQAMQIMNQGCQGQHNCGGDREQAVQDQYNQQMQAEGRRNMNYRMKNP